MSANSLFITVCQIAHAMHIYRLILIIYHFQIGAQFESDRWMSVTL